MKSLIILALLIAASASTRADDFKPGPSTTIEVQSGPTEPIVEPTPTPPKTDEQNLTKPRWAEVNAILDDIKIQNPPRSHRMIFKVGLIQLIPNTADAVLLGQDSNLISLGATYITNPWDNIGLEIRGIYGQNVFPNSASPNDASAYTYWLDLGPRYTFYLDNTKLDNNLAFKLLFHDNGSNFKLLADTTTNKYTFVTHYQSFSFSVERSLPVTRKLGVFASF